MEALEKQLTGITPRFLGAHTNKLDSKGRLSVPADYRKSLEQEAGEGTPMYCFPAFNGTVIDCGGPSLINILMSAISNHDYFDEDREILEIAVTSGMTQLQFDENGRVTLPRALSEYAQLDDRATLVGLGERFQIWNPSRHEKLMSRARELASDNRDVFRARSLPSLSTGRGDDG